jgi:4-hydroxyphenylpyruvate dioxygenase
MPDTSTKTTTDTAVRIEGLEFVEFAAPDPAQLVHFLEQLGFRACARHRSKDVTLYRQGEINFIVNATPGSFAQSYAQQRGASICALALRVSDANSAYQTLLARGAWEASTTAGVMELNIPALECIGGSQIYLIDRYGQDLSIYDIDFKTLPETEAPAEHLQRVSALTLNVCAGRSQEWNDFFCQLFGFSATQPGFVTSPDGALQLRFQDLEGEHSDLADEGFASIELSAQDLAGTQGNLNAAGLQLRPAGPQSTKASKRSIDCYVVQHPQFDSSVNFLIGR